ncbi:mediator of RNA polymerase II transcription subunit 33A [Selaginella moellendorffii]|uniref:mediator of RNA polymerase II transcription subunit 33A n=1 Tax=Selaginella moellendorffii TaxID=88036 RepID=UPI000D1C31AB|nr:mediator of RNA polymerase II transcription subunit 33A [Selaginella moellendorffii]|eukprot:XP_024528036.1 mediator of RNA polymerase II transcription subunit 33A [Selaginella moellendorffii]
MAERAAELARTAAERLESPLPWAVSACSVMHGAGVSMPSLDLAKAMVADVPSPQLMPFVDQSIASGLVFPMHMLSLLAAKVIPVRQQQPETYMMFLNLLDTYAFTLSLRTTVSSTERSLKSILEILELPFNGDAPKELGTVAVQFILALCCRLVDATAEDWSMALSSPSKPTGSYLTVNDFDDDFGRRRQEESEQARGNSLRALELVTNFLHHKKTSVLLRLARRNLSEQWGLFVQKLKFLEVIIRDTTLGAPRETGELFARLAAAIQQGLVQEQSNRRVVYKVLLDTNTSMSVFGNYWGTGRTAPWLPFDIFMEDALEGRRVPASSTAEALADLIKSLRAVQGASWHDVFLGLWIAGLRHVNREREHVEGPRPHVDSRLCMLLSIVPLASAAVIEEEENSQQYNVSRVDDNERGRRAGFVSSLQVLGQFEGLLCPPPIAVPAANQAAMKASAFVAGIKTTRDGYVPADGSTKAVGNMRHLIVEICISRGLLDASAYLWPGYAVAIPLSGSSQSSPWAAFMEGSSLAGPLKGALINTPASSVAELEKVYQIAINGAENERVAAASILCGASLVRSWSIQEHAVRLAVRLVSPPVPAESRSGHPLMNYSSMLLAALGALTEVDAVHVLSLYGMFPELAAALLPICEVFGSATPAPQSTGEEVSPHMVFSVAFLLLLRLWKFHRPPLEHRLLGFESPLGGDLSLDYILQLRNLGLSSQGTQPVHHVKLDSFPKLKAWYTQNQACVASTLSGLSGSGNPVHQNADRLLNMMFKRIKGAAPDETSARPMLPAWEIMTSVPFVLDAVLTACGHGRLSSKDLTTGLRDLVDFLPASIATIVSYFTAEVTRGLWKYASMNGNDWPSPAANLLSVEAEIKEILAATGVQVPNLVTGSLGGNAPVSLPLPLAAFLSLTITFRQDKSSELVLGVAGPALESTAGGSPWPSMPVVAALWAQKVKRWHSFIVFGASRTVFKQDKNAVKELLRSCFAVTTGTTGTLMSKLQVHGGVGALLGHGGMQGGQYPLAPGILYLGIYPALHEIMFVTDEILFLVVKAARDLTAAKGTTSKISCASAMSRVFQASTLGASLLHISGGSTLVQTLYSESLPAWFLAGGNPEESSSSTSSGSGEGSLVEGYAVAHFALLSGALVWGISSTSTKTSHRTRRRRVLGSHMEFLASALDGKIALGCGRATWKAYLTGFIALLVSSTPNWILDVKLDVLKRLARGLRLWHEQELAVALLERGGPAAMGPAAELA